MNKLKPITRKRLYWLGITMERLGLILAGLVLVSVVSMFFVFGTLVGLGLLIEGVVFLITLLPIPLLLMVSGRKLARENDHYARYKKRWLH